MSIYRHADKFPFASAFTLAEVLITLGLIGVVASMTIPNLVQNNQTKNTVTVLKKEYSILSQAYTSAVADHGPPGTWGLSGTAGADATGSLNTLNVLIPYFKITKNCGAGTGCFPTSPYRFLDNNPGAANIDAATGFGKAILADGSLILTESFGTCTPHGSAPALQAVCGDIYFDINGFKGPNQYGADWFAFWLTNSGVVPLGTALDTSATFDTNCKNKPINSWGCTAWVIYNENMDYLKSCGSTLSWSGPTSCN